MGNSNSSKEVDIDALQDEQAREVEESLSEVATDTVVEGRDISPVVSEHDEPAYPQQSQNNASASDAVNQTESNGEQTQYIQQNRSSPWYVPLSVGSGDIPVNNALVTPERMSQQKANRHEASDSEDPYNLSGIAWQASNDTSPEACLEDAALATCSFLSSEMAGAILGEDWEGEGHVPQADQHRHFIEASGDSVSFGDYSRPAGIFFPWVSPSKMTDPSIAYQRRLSNLSSVSDVYGSTLVTDFDPPVSQNNEWMGRSIESLILGYLAAAPVLALPEAEQNVRKCTVGKCTRRKSVSSLYSKRSPHHAARRTSLSHGARFRRSSSYLSLTNENASNAGPNVLLSLFAREGTGKLPSARTVSPLQRLREMGGHSLFDMIDKPSGGMASEVALLKDAIDCGDWTHTQIIISRLAPRLVGDPIASRARNEIDDPTRPASASRFHAGGGRLGLEREAFVAAGGVQQLLRTFSEPEFVGDEIIKTNDARELSDITVVNKLSSCWSEVLASLRELVYALPSLVENGDILDDGDFLFLPFLFTLLAHDACFDGAATLIEEILGSQSHILPQAQQSSSTADENATAIDVEQARVYIPPPSTFFLGNIPDLYELIAGFNCRKLAHFCRLLALLIFEPEDRQILESQSVLKSVELLQLRRDRAARAGRDATVDMNQAIIIGDTTLLDRLLSLLRIMNFGPPLSNGTAYHIITHFPFVAGTLPMIGLNEINDFQEVDRLERLARSLLSEENDLRPNDLGAVTDMLERLSPSLRHDSLEQTTQIGHIINVINAATQSGIVVGTPRLSRPVRNRHRGNENLTSSQDTRTSGGDIAAAAETLASVHAADSHNVEASEVQIVRVGDEGVVPAEDPVIHRIQLSGSPEARINFPEDAANELQFNAFLLAPFQVEVLFVMCTLLGGRRKIDTQKLFGNQGLIPILDDLFHRLPFSRSDTSLSGDATTFSSSQEQEDSHGIHGPGCECTPESAMSVQFLRLIHNFCDRDCDDHTDRRLLLSKAEREYILSTNSLLVFPSPVLRPGLLSKLTKAFMSESDDSPYRFWLASCIESYLRGSCIREQLFVAQSGLLNRLLQHITSERIHCAGSLQTSFDLLGELCKANVEMLRLVMSRLDDLSFRRLMEVAALNLVDSNVFIRSLVLSVERAAVSTPVDGNSCNDKSQHVPWSSKVGPSTRFFLTHSWWNTTHFDRECVESNEENTCDDSRPTDWFPPFQVNAPYYSDPLALVTARSRDWIFSPDLLLNYAESNLVEPIATIGRFLGVNRTRLLLDLLQVVHFENINHENICCLNTALILMIFAHRRGELCELVNEVKNVRLVDEALIESMRSLGTADEDHSVSSEPASVGLSKGMIDVVSNFVELLWFWKEYYAHRGRDRVSIEFSSHLHFNEWRNVVNLLTDDGSSSSLVSKPLRLPRSPYQRAPRVNGSHIRGA
jgi:hypothetical protein